MGTIVEFYTARQADDFPQPVGRGGRTLVQSLSINSLMVKLLLDALTGTSLDPLVGDGSDAALSIFVTPADLQRLKAQSVQWSLQSDEVLREIYEAANEGVNEAEWAKRGLLVVVR